MAVAALVAGFIAVLVLALDDDGGDEPEASTLAPAGSLGAPDVGAVLDDVGNSVVAIRTGTVAPGALLDPEADAVPDTGAGSGVVLSADGLVLTNDHVISGADQLIVILADGTETRADFVGSVPGDDVALIRVRDVEDLVPATLGSSAGVEVGDPVIAVGNAFNLPGTPTVTSGIVSATGRTLDAGEIRLRDLIQTDAAINPGNSGGPLFDGSGAVIGINTAIVSVSTNVGFALSIDHVNEVVERILSGDAEVTPQGFLGVTVIDVGELEEELVVEFAVEVDEGAFVSEIVPGTAADAADLRTGDVILAVDGTRASGRDDVTDLISRRDADEVVTLEIARGDQRLVVEAVLGARGG